MSIFNYIFYDYIFIGEDFITDEENRLAASCMEKTVGVYVFSKSNSPGTLEDILIPMFESAQSDLVKETEKFIDSTFSWKIKQDNAEKRSLKLRKGKKAIMTTIGQGERSQAHPWNVIL